mmetsp:Transcript_70/g.143  ORF Transcript_70/g.143 Transcript_70/m.143 type:complete len:244 (+) Transcript_70:247-978(+)
MYTSSYSRRNVTDDYYHSTAYDSGGDYGSDDSSNYAMDRGLSGKPHETKASKKKRKKQDESKNQRKSKRARKVRTEYEPEESEFDNPGMRAILSQEKETQAQRKRSLEALRDSTDIVTMETALYLVEEVRAAEDSKDASVVELVGQAKVAVPYLLHKTLVQLMTKPDPVGPGFSARQATSITESLIRNMRLDTRMFGISETALVKRCDIRTIDAQRLCPHLLRFKHEAQDTAEKVERYVKDGK